MIKVAILGASYLQLPLIIKAKERGFQTHVFAWAANDVGEKVADFFYPISIDKKELILNKCREIGIAAICSIGSDLAMGTANYVANVLGLIGNSIPSTIVSTNKYEMRKCFERNCDPSPNFIKVHSEAELAKIDFKFPVIVKPVDRSGGRGVTKVDTSDGLVTALANAFSEGFEKTALIEEYIDGDEYSVVAVSYAGVHTVIDILRKYSTPGHRCIDVAHLEPALIDPCLSEAMIKVTTHALSSLGLQYGASHTELKVSKSGSIFLIEVGGRLGGDCIGSDLVYLSTGLDLVNAVLDISLGICPVLNPKPIRASAIRYVFNQTDLEIIKQIKKSNPARLVRVDVADIDGRDITDSSKRYGYFLLVADSATQLIPYMPQL